MALPTTTPSDAPRVETVSPEAAYVSMDNIALPKEAQISGVAVRADARLEDVLPNASTITNIQTPLSE